jgi:hypothetical protein
VQHEVIAVSKEIKMIEVQKRSDQEQKEFFNPQSRGFVKFSCLGTADLKYGVIKQAQIDGICRSDGYVDLAKVQLGLLKAYAEGRVVIVRDKPRPKTKSHSTGVDYVGK